MEFVKWCRDSGWYDNIEIITPKKNFYQIVKENGYPIISKIKSQFLHTYQSNKKETSRTTLLLYGKSKINNEKTTSKFKLANKHFNILHPNFDLKISDSCCNILKKKPFEKYAIENDIYGFIDGEMIAEGGIKATSTQKRINGGVRYVLKQNIYLS